MDQLYILSERLVKNVSMQYQRYLAKNIDWSEHLIGIRGSRGVGKTTMMLQHIRHNKWSSQVALYVLTCINSSFTLLYQDIVYTL